MSPTSALRLPVRQPPTAKNEPILEPRPSPSIPHLAAFELDHQASGFCYVVLLHTAVPWWLGPCEGSDTAELPSPVHFSIPSKE